MEEKVKRTTYEIRLLFPLESGITAILRRYPEAQKAEALIQYKLWANCSARKTMRRAKLHSTKQKIIKNRR